MKDDETYYKAMLTRDARFDGIFFIGVKTTGIYCRPICPAQPKRQNIQFYPHAHAAEQAGYRPCLRCRPESAPQSAAWLGTSAIVRRALNTIHNSNIGNSYHENAFASRFGLSARHLRRLFQQEIGKTPKQIIDIQRLNFARQLIVESHISQTQIAFLSGFGSVRRFNDAIKKRFQRTPSELRKNRSKKTRQQQKITLQLSYRPPFPWQRILSAFKKHELYGIENISQQQYQRVIKINKHIAHISVINQADKNQLALTVSADDFSQLYTIVQKVRQMFDISSNPLVIQQTMYQHPTLKKLYQQHPGLRIPKGWDAFETSISTILGQLVSVKRANQLCQQLIKHYGEKIIHPITQQTSYLFPTAESIINGSLDEIGTTALRKQALKNFCNAILNQEITLDPYQDHSDFIKACVHIKGIGYWTAEYIAMKALGMTDAFPKDDLIIKRLLEKHKNIKADNFKPWRAYLTMYLWTFHQQETEETLC